MAATVRMVAAGCVVLSLAGCGTLIRDDDVLVTGSIKPQPVSLAVPQGAPPAGIAPSDWLQAKVALESALGAKEDGASMPWENKATGARGTATPVGALKDNKCRDFRISIVDHRGEHWVQGEACRDGRGPLTLNQVRILGQA